MTDNRLTDQAPDVDHPARGDLSSVRRLRVRLAGVLWERQAEIEQTVLARVAALEDPAETGDPAYVEGLRAAVHHGVAYALEAVERDESRPAPIPIPLLAQARHAAREGVSLDMVLRRYLAGYTLLGDFVHRVAEETGALPTDAFLQLRREQAALLDRVLGAISEEHMREGELCKHSHSERRVELVRRLLAGELLDTGELGYQLEPWHVGVVAAGEAAEEALKDLARALDCRLLLIPQPGNRFWSWLGGTKRTESAGVAMLARKTVPETVSIAIGEPGQGAAGWRLTHRQASRAWPLAGGRGERVVCYAEVAMLASILQDEVLACSLGDLYLSPLNSDRDDGYVLRETLRAYLATGRNVSSTAAALRVSRRTVTNRLDRAELRLGRPLNACSGELEIALRLEDLIPQISK